MAVPAGLGCMAWRSPPSSSSASTSSTTPSPHHRPLKTPLAPSPPRSLPLHSPNDPSLPLFRRARPPPFPSRSPRARGRVVCEVLVEVGDGSPSAEGEQQKHVGVGSRIRVAVPLKVYHVPKVPEFDLAGQEGEVKDVLVTWKGKPISANLPYKVQFKVDIGGRQVKFIAHLKDEEFEVVS